MSKIKKGDRVLLSQELLDIKDDAPTGVYTVVSESTKFFKNIYLISSEDEPYLMGTNKENLIPYKPLKELYNEIF